jgi:hypothetical protein
MAGKPFINVAVRRVSGSRQPLQLIRCSESTGSGQGVDPLGIQAPPRRAASCPQQFRWASSWRRVPAGFVVCLLTGRCRIGLYCGLAQRHQCISPTALIHPRARLVCFTCHGTGVSPQAQRLHAGFRWAGPVGGRNQHHGTRHAFLALGPVGPRRTTSLTAGYLAWALCGCPGPFYAAAVSV